MEKNKIYDLKKECGVMRASPHYCIFVQSAKMGSAHDYACFKETYNVYCEYLLKTPEERNILPADTANPSWAALLDSGFIGPEVDTPGLRKITIKRPSSLRVSNKCYIFIN
jgi:hypothetical protein